MIVLGIESSCDETGVAIYSDQGLLSNKLFSQIEIHNIYGGVVPELASRDHLKKVIPLIKESLNDANITKEQINYIAYTSGPGLVGALLVGSSIAKTLSFALDIPSIGINHLEGHLLAPFLEEEKPKFPYLGVLLSGGHSQIIIVNSLSNYDLIGQSIDDAVGEAFDKTAKILDLGYPGGAALSKLAEKGKPNFRFPRPMIDRPGLYMSFSGLKTAALNKVIELKKNENYSEIEKANVAKAFENAIIETVLIKVKRAIKETGLKSIVLSGGVSSNTNLRKAFKKHFSEQNINVYYPRPEFCVDNGAMIAYAGYERIKYMLENNIEIKDNNIIKARWPLSTIKLSHN